MVAGIQREDGQLKAKDDILERARACSETEGDEIHCNMNRQAGLRLSRMWRAKLSNLGQKPCMRSRAYKLILASEGRVSHGLKLLSAVPPWPNLAQETAAGHAQKDAGKAKNASDLLKAREANLKYEVDDLGTTLLGRHVQPCACCCLLLVHHDSQLRMC